MTYSIVAADPATGTVGVAVQSHWFAVGPIVPWARAGVGAVATQSIAEPAYGPRLLDRLEAGEAPQEALGALLAEDPRRRSGRSPSSTLAAGWPSTPGSAASPSPATRRAGTSARRRT